MSKDYQRQNLESSDSDYSGSESLETIERTPIKTKSKSIAGKSDSTSVQLSEQIKLALSIDENGNMILQSIAGRPPSIASSERQGLHTVAWATYESMVVNALNSHKPATAFGNIMALSDSLLGQQLTSSLTIKKDIDVEAFRKWQDEFERIDKINISDIAVKQYALKGKVTEIFPIMEKAIKAILSNQNLQKGVAYAAVGNIPSSKDEGSKIKTAIEQLSNLEHNLNQSTREARKKSIAQSIAQETSELFHYPYVSEKQQISKEQKAQLVKEREYRGLASFRDNDVNLLALQLSNLLSALYYTYPNLLGTEKSKTYPLINEAVVDKVVEDGGWKEAVEKWYRQETGEQESKGAVSFLVKRVNDILHTDLRNIGLFEEVDSEAEVTEESKSLKSGTSEGELDIEEKSTAQTQKIVEIDKDIVISKLNEQIQTYTLFKVQKVNLEQLTEDLNNLTRNCIEQQEKQEQMNNQGK
jgi:hypothetical protein